MSIWRAAIGNYTASFRFSLMKTLQITSLTVMFHSCSRHLIGFAHLWQVMGRHREYCVLLHERRYRIPQIFPSLPEAVQLCSQADQKRSFPLLKRWFLMLKGTTSRSSQEKVPIRVMSVPKFGGSGNSLWMLKYSWYQGG